MFEGYHESLLASAERARAGDFSLPDEDANDPDISFHAYLRWCASQPPTPEETWVAFRAGRFDLERGLAREALSC